MEVEAQAGWTVLAELLRPQGRRGEVLAELRTTHLALFDAAAGVYLVAAGKGEPAQDAYRITVQEHWQPTGRNAGRIVVKLKGCDSINEAEKLAGCRLMVPASERPPLEADAYYVSDLVGCTLFNLKDPGGEVPVGEVLDLEFVTSPDGRLRKDDVPPLLSVRIAEAGAPVEAVLVPFVRAWLISVDVAQKRIVMDLPEGLIEADGDSGN